MRRLSVAGKKKQSYRGIGGAALTPEKMGKREGDSKMSPYLEWGKTPTREGFSGHGGTESEKGRRGKNGGS